MICDCLLHVRTVSLIMAHYVSARRQPARRYEHGESIINYPHPLIGMPFNNIRVLSFLVLKLTILDKCANTFGIYKLFIKQIFKYIQLSLK